MVFSGDSGFLHHYITEIKAELLGQIIEEEFWLVEIKFGSIIEYSDRESLKFPQEVCN